MAVGGFRGILELLGVWLRPGARTSTPAPTPTTATIRLEACTRAPGLEAHTGPVRIKAHTGGAS